MSFLVFLSERIDSARKNRHARRNTRELFHIALTFNRRHTFPFDVKGRWMCPICNTVHASTSYSFLTGLQYPACCSIEAGHRLHPRHATGCGLS
jgi:hypothetical protein